MEKIYTFKVALKHYKRLWRRIEIKSDQTLGDFDNIIREVFNYDDFDHLSEFYLGKLWQAKDALGEIYPGGKSGPGAKKRIDQLGISEGDKLEYVYDFGSSVENVIVLEKVSDVELGVKYPRLIGQNKPKYQACENCKKQGKDTNAVWVCIECSNEQQREVLICENCLTKEHEEHYAEEVLY